MYSDESIISDQITPCGDCCHHDHNKRLSVVVSNYLFTILNICIIVCRCILYKLLGMFEIQYWRKILESSHQKCMIIFFSQKEFYFYFISIFIDRRKGNSSKENVTFRQKREFNRWFGVNFINILRASFAPSDLRWTYWRTAWSVQHKSWA